MIAAGAPARFELLRVDGPDRERLLHGLVTGDVRNLAPGAFVHGFFTSGQGRILADYRLFAEENAFLLLLPRGTAEAVASHLDKYRLASRVEIGVGASEAVRELRGVADPLLSDAAREAGVALLADPANAPASSEPATGEEAWLAFPVGSTDGAGVEAWLSALAARGAVERVDEGELERRRIEAGELRFGVDFGPENFPQETGRESAVSYTKGCYLGQEIVARIHYRGGVQKGPRGLLFDGSVPPAAGTELVLDGRAVGRATSIAISATRSGSRAVGLGILHQRAHEPGTRLAFEGGSAAVVALPFETAT